MLKNLSNVKFLIWLSIPNKFYQKEQLLENGFNEARNAKNHSSFWQ